ncbi:MAG: hypothetical protein KKA44_14495 [Alphaproteobacteria bacterium]|nr:hypothetical protein [Alphaproteobacteria bacterium]MBU0864325.1 hypothetical protein [Alphaproteobacteria bacterium]MBU1826165.1 hypothetical protein [Alphaproteobacteria bacterium]
MAVADQSEDYFVPPPLVKRDAASVSDEIGTTSPTQEIKLDEILISDENFIFLGSRHSGKSSLCHHMITQIANGCSNNPSIPVYIDSRSYKLNSYSIKRSVTNFYGNLPSGFSLDQALENGYFVFLVDNFSDKDEDFLVAFSRHVEEFSNNRWICFGTPESGGVSKDRVFTEHLPNFTKVHIKDLSRRSIRQLSNRWSKEGTGEAKQMFEAVMNQLVRDGLPRTPYMVSLLLWSINKKRNLEKINEATLLNNISDHLLGKADFKLAKRGILNPVGKEITLQNLAIFLQKNNGYCTENEATAFLIEFFNRKKLGYTATDVLQKLVECGILKINQETVSFKYDCFQEYFMARAIGANRSLFDHYLEEINFLDVPRELELLAGLRQENSDMIGAISAVLDTRSPTRFNDCDIKKFDQTASKELEVGTTRSRLNKIKRTRLTDDQVDEMMDEADRRAMARGEPSLTESIENADGDIVRATRDRAQQAISADKAKPTDPLRPSTHMASIELLAKIIKNSDFTDYEIKGPATKTVLESWAKIYLVLMEEMMEILSAISGSTAEKISDEEMEFINYIMSKLMFNMTGSVVIDQISSPSMSETLHEIIREGNLSTAEYIMILYILEDTNDPQWKNLWCEVIRDKKRSGFVLECFIERLWYLAHTKALDDDQSKRLITVVEEIETRLGWSSAKKGEVLQNIKNATALAALKNN